MTAQEYLAGLKQLAADATEGPWEVVKEHHRCYVVDEDFCYRKDSPLLERGVYLTSEGAFEDAFVHVHESFDAHQIAPDVAGNCDYEDGGIIRNEDAEFIVASRTAVPRLVAALEAVLVLHERVETQSQYPMPPDWKPMKLEVCGLCKRPGAGDALHPWPCPTVAAIETALGEQK